MSKERKVSNEEQQFSDWLKDAVVYGLVEDFKDQPETYELVPKAQVWVSDKKCKTLLQPHRYTPDFRVKLTTLGQDILQDAFPVAHLTPEWKERGLLWVDTKGGFTVQHGQVQMFQANRKLMWYYQGIWIEKVVPWISPVDRKGRPKPKPKRCLFLDTYCPSNLRVNNSLKISNMGRLCKSVEEFIQSKMTLFTK
jgi:hypothetical protein